MILKEFFLLTHHTSLVYCFLSHKASSPLLQAILSILFSKHIAHLALLILIMRKRDRMYF